MSRIYDFPSTDQTLDEASEWIAKLDRGLTADERKQIRVWLDSGTDRADVLLNMARLWDRMEVLSGLRDVLPAPAPRRRRRIGYISAAAIVLLAVAIWFAVPIDMSTNPGMESVVTVQVPKRYETAIGEQSTVSLSDGTRVVLNTNTLINVEYSAQHRLIRLERGELQVDVAEDPARLLSVIAGDNIIQAVGTVFNIELSDEQRVEVVVTEGEVLVGIRRNDVDTENRLTPTVLPLSSVTVAAGEELVLGEENAVVTEVSDRDIQIKLSWQSGDLVFQGEALEDAIAEVSRYTSVEFAFMDEELRHVRIVGLFKAGDVDGLLGALRENFDIAYRRTDDQVVLLSSR